MKYRQLHCWPILSVFLSVSLFNTACRPLILPTHPPLPGDGGIVFQIWDGVFKNPSSLAVMRGDGTDVHTIYTDNNYLIPIWSDDKTDVFFICYYDGAYKYAYVYGKVASHQHGVICPDEPEHGVERMHWYAPDQLLWSETERVNDINTNSRIVVRDVRTCEVTKVLYSDRFENGNLGEADFSVKGELLFTNWMQGTITVLNLATNEQHDLGEGFGGAWSPDGERLVFTGKDGIYIADRTGTNVARIVDLTSSLIKGENHDGLGNWPPLAAWSPDGEDIVFHRRQGDTYEIVVHNIEMGTDTVIYTGGMNPDWK